ncbi:MAG: O-antigen ligase family protein [Candidatus Tectomicrobia bacterium]|nr:O-antigen ligase family protein [Candidatus Tectomicrobia bacterium]
MRFERFILAGLVFLLPVMARWPFNLVLNATLAQKIEPVDLFFALTFPIWLLRACRSDRRAVRLPPGSIVLAAFLCGAALSALLAPDVGAALLEVAGFLYVAFFYLFLFNLLRREEERRFAVDAFLLSACAVLLIGAAGIIAYRVAGVESFAIARAATYAQPVGEVVTRARATFSGENLFFVYGLLAAALSLPRLAGAGGWVRAAARANVALMAIIAVSAPYRGAFIFWGLCTIALWDAGRRWWRKALLGLTALLFLATLGLSIVQARVQLFPARLAADRDSGQISLTLSRRDAFYYLLHRGAVRMFLEAPLLGVGPGRFNAMIRQERYGAAAGLGGLDPHSTYFGALAESGLVGALPLFLFYAAILVLLLRLARRAAAPGAPWRMLLACYVLLLVYAVYIDLTTMRVLWFIYALIAAAARFEGEPSGVEQPPD